MKVLPFLKNPAGRIARVGFRERVAPVARPYLASSDQEVLTRSRGVRRTLLS